MALKPVQDPNLLAALEAPETPALGAQAPVTDPALLAQLEGTGTPSDGGPEFGNDVPKIPAAPAPAPEEQGLFSRAMSAVQGDPIINMWLSGLKDIAFGAPEAAVDIVNNATAQGVAGITAPFVANDMEDAAGFVRDFTQENSRSATGESAGRLEEGLGRAFEPLGNIKRKLGETALDVTGSPAAATAADMLPDLGMAFLGGQAKPQGAPHRMLAADEMSGVKGGIPQPDKPVNPMVEELRAADIRMRPSDVRAMEPGAKKVPGEFREKFADAPDLKKDTTLHNQARMSDMAAKELGIEKLDEVSFAKAKEAPGKTYDMVEDVLRDREMSQDFVDTFREAAASAKLEKGEGYSVTRVIGALRRRAAKRMQSEDVKTEEAGFADRELANKLEEQMGKELDAAGEPQLVQQYRDARQKFAQIHDVETATVANQIDANVLKKIGKKTGNLSGRLKLIADASEFAPNVTQHSLKTAARAGGEIEGSKEGIVKGLLKSGIRKIPGMDVGKPGFQNTLGRVDEVREANYGRPSNVSPRREPSQGDLDLREILELDTPGEVGSAPSRPQVVGQESMFGAEAFDLAAPRGRAGRSAGPTIADDLGDVMVNGEPLAEPAVNFRADTLADILGLSEPLVKPPLKPRPKPRG